MARITKIELEQQLIASQRDNAALRHELSVLRARVAQLEHEAQEATCAGDDTGPVAGPGDVLAKPVVRADWPTAPRKLPAHFVAAREAAMRLGRVVRVGA